ncbi:hypothetical protein FEZ32_11415 [Acidipropionibacterium jensenii]|uniref:hypothetical protein n=1 Tax=Acidipropionibacterium jensenii TaxID=1749 RepID=UPI00110ACC81|nr:hypothetical protein [Acidipropionibacterium jensenii]QCV88876.1 hypothetical protein FEZ32_11415 [Acidipropionibacterium jensenii]
MSRTSITRTQQAELHRCTQAARSLSSARAITDQRERGRAIERHFDQFGSGCRYIPPRVRLHMVQQAATTY